MKQLTQKFYRVKDDLLVGSFSIVDMNKNDGKMEYWLDVDHDWLSVFEAKRLVKQLQKSLSRIERHKAKHK